MAIPTDSTGKVRELEAFAVGMLDDLDKWITSEHQRSATFWAGVLLSIGFALQLWLSLVRPTQTAFTVKESSQAMTSD